MMLLNTIEANVSLCATPIIPSRGDTVERYGHAFIAVSLFNSYYSAARLEALIRWADYTFPSSHLPIFDLPHAFTLTAQRGSSEGAVRRALEEGRKLHNRVSKIRTNHAIDARKHKILSWNDLANNRDYLTIRIDVEHAYHEDEKLREACLDMADSFVSASEPSAARRESARRLAVRYLLDELPLLIDSPRIFACPASAFLYHRAPPLMADLFDGRFTLKPATSQGYFIVTDRQHDPLQAPPVKLPYPEDRSVKMIGA